MSHCSCIDSAIIYSLEMSSAIHQRASDKAFAKIETLNFRIQSDERNIAAGSYGGITYEEAVLVLECNKTELKVWQYIAESIEKSNKNQ